MNHKSWPLIADALSDVCFGFGLPTSHISDCEFPYKDTRQRLHGAAPWFWERAALWFIRRSYLVSVAAGRPGRWKGLLPNHNQQELPGTPRLRQKNVQCNFSCQAQMKPLNRPQTSCCFPRPLLIECVCVVFSFLRQTTTLLFSSPACSRQECKSKCCSGCIRHVCPHLATPCFG